LNLFAHAVFKILFSPLFLFGIRAGAYQHKL
jgi:hypothetical protein